MLLLFFYAAASQTSADTTTSVGDDNTEDKPTKKSKKGKRVQWPADDANLAVFHFFEMDEDERGHFLFCVLILFYWFDIIILLCQFSLINCVSSVLFNYYHTNPASALWF